MGAVFRTLMDELVSLAQAHPDEPVPAENPGANGPCNMRLADAAFTVLGLHANAPCSSAQHVADALAALIPVAGGIFVDSALSRIPRFLLPVPAVLLAATTDSDQTSAARTAASCSPFRLLPASLPASRYQGLPVFTGEAPALFVGELALDSYSSPDAPVGVDLDGSPMLRPGLLGRVATAGAVSILAAAEHSDIRMRAVHVSEAAAAVPAARSSATRLLAAMAEDRVGHIRAAVLGALARVLRPGTPPVDTASVEQVRRRALMALDDVDVGVRLAAAGLIVGLVDVIGDRKAATRALLALHRAAGELGAWTGPGLVALAPAVGALGSAGAAQLAAKLQPALTEESRSQSRLLAAAAGAGAWATGELRTVAGTDVASPHLVRHTEVLGAIEYARGAVADAAAANGAAKAYALMAHADRPVATNVWVEVTDASLLGAALLAVSVRFGAGGGPAFDRLLLELDGADGQARESVRAEAPPFAAALNMRLYFLTTSMHVQRIRLLQPSGAPLVDWLPVGGSSLKSHL